MLSKKPPFATEVLLIPNTYSMLLMPTINAISKPLYPIFIKASGVYF